MSQVSFDVQHHPETREALGDEPPILTGTLKIAGDLDVTQDLNNGDRILITVADADGQVIARAYAEVGPPAFQNLRVPKVGIVGVNRAHKAKIGGE